MGVNDAREQLEACKQEYLKLERQYEELRSGIRGLLSQLGMNDESIKKMLEDYDYEV